MFHPLQLLYIGKKAKEPAGTDQHKCLAADFQLSVLCRLYRLVHGGQLAMMPKYLVDNNAEANQVGGYYEADGEDEKINQCYAWLQPASTAAVVWDGKILFTLLYLPKMSRLSVQFAPKCTFFRLFLYYHIRALCHQGTHFLASI